MVPFISQSPAGQTAAQGPATQDSRSPQETGDRFESAMNHALEDSPVASAPPKPTAQRTPGAPQKSDKVLNSRQSDPIPEPSSDEPTPAQIPLEAKGRSGHARLGPAPGVSTKADLKTLGDAASDVVLLQAIAANVTPVPAASVKIAKGSLCNAASPATGLVAERGQPAGEDSHSESSGPAESKSDAIQLPGSGVLPKPTMQPGLSESAVPQGQSTPAESSPATSASETQARTGAPAEPKAIDFQNGSSSSVTGPVLAGNNLPVGFSPSTPKQAEAPPVAAQASASPNPAGDSQGPVGISAAQYEMSMKKAQKMPKVAELSQQNLPGDGAFSAAKPETPASVSSTIAAATGVVDQSDNRISALERTHDLVAMHALRVSQSGNETIRVVIEPGGGTRLSLELRFNNGNVDAQAVLHRGDFEFLNQHWAELQQRLEPRGVQLGALECSTQSSTDQGHSPRSGRQSPDEPQPRSAFAQFALDGSVAEAAKRSASRTKTHPGWETWA